MAKRRLPEFLRPPEARALVAAAGSDRDRLIVQCGLYLGLRVSEIVKLRVEDVDPDERTVFVREGKGKKDRMLPCPELLAQPLREWAAGRLTGWLFPSPVKEGRHLTTRAVQYLVGRLREAAAIVRRCTPHTMRHTNATSLLRSGADICEVQRLLGHSSIQTTSRYLHVDTSRLRGVVDRLDFGEGDGGRDKSETLPDLHRPGEGGGPGGAGGQRRQPGEDGPPAEDAPQDVGPVAEGAAAVPAEPPGGEPGGEGGGGNSPPENGPGRPPGDAGGAAG